MSHHYKQLIVMLAVLAGTTACSINVSQPVHVGSGPAQLSSAQDYPEWFYDPFYYAGYYGFTIGLPIETANIDKVAQIKAEAEVSRMQKLHVDDLYQELIQASNGSRYDEAESKTKLTSISRVNVNLIELRQRYFDQDQGRVIYLYLIPTN